jgi:hypothetical protein
LGNGYIKRAHRANLGDGRINQCFSAHWLHSNLWHQSTFPVNLGIGKGVDLLLTDQSIKNIIHV